MRQSQAESSKETLGGNVLKGHKSASEGKSTCEMSPSAARAQRQRERERESESEREAAVQCSLVTAALTAASVHGNYPGSHHT